MTNIEQLMQDSEVMRMLKLGNPERSKDFNAPDLAVGLFDIERQLKDPLGAAIYNSSDPDGTIASFDTALMLNNLGIDMPSAHKMARMGFSSSATGIDTRDKNYWEALKATAQHSHWQDMKGITTSLYRITGNRDFLELANGYDGKVRTSPVSNTYGEMGDLVLDSVQPAMSSLKFMATTALLSWIPGGMANKVWGPAVAKTIAQGGGLAANAVNWFSTGYSQAGDVLYNVMRMEDAQGNTLPWDSPVGGALFHGLAGLMGLVELGSMEMFPWYKQLKTRFTDRELLKHIERGFLAATKSFLWKGAAGTISEGGEEGIQTGLGIGFENALKALANKDGAKFDLTSFGDTIKEAAKATYDAGKSMFLTSFLTAGFGQGAYSMKLRASAKKNFLPSKDSIPIDSLFVGVPKDTIEQIEDGVSTGPIEPIRVVNVGTHLAPVDQAELAKAARAKKNGAEAMEVVVEDMPSVESSDWISMLHRAAVATEAKIVDDTRLGFESEEALDRAAFLLASNTESIQRTGGGIDITLRGEDGKLSKLSLGLIGEGQEATDPDISYIDDPKAPYSLSAMTTERALEWQERQLIKESLGDIVSHTGGRISTADLEANVDAVKLVAETLNIPTDQMLRENLVFKLEKASPKGERGYIENVSIEGKKQYTIHISDKADATTILHEVGHFMRGTASKEQLAGFTSYYGKGNDAVWLEDIDKIGDQYVVNGKHFDTFDEAKRLVEANEEAFADDFVAYLRTGQAPTEGLGNIFRRMKAVLQRFVREFGYQLDPAVKQAFDRLLGGDPQGITGSFGTIPTDTDGNVLFQESSEYDAVAERFKGTEKWMRAPNGKATNLTEQQWVQVRTPSFKNWFGDWEASENFRWLLSAENVVDLAGDEFKKGSKPLTRQVSEYYAQKHGGIVHVPGIGEVILADNGIKSSISHGLGRVKAVAFAAVPDVLLHGRLFSEIQNYKARGYTSLVIAAPVGIGGEEYVVEVVINKSATRNASYYLHEVDTKRKLGIGPLQDTSFKGDSPTPASKLMISLLHNRGKFDSSKVVDENGEPKVVYHNTDSVFTEFRNGNKGGLSGNGIYFSEYPLRQFGQIEVPVFLNIRNPITRETEVEGMRELNSAGIQTRMIPDVLDRFPEFDGVMNRSEITVRDPGQIKSATGNVGTFGTENPNIFFQDAPPTDSDAFKMWFGGSVVVDGQGNPLVVYHGSPFAGITQFDRHGANGGEPGLVYATGNLEVADDFSYEQLPGGSSLTFRPGTRGQVYPLYMSIGKPLDFRSLTMKDFNNIKSAIEMYSAEKDLQLQALDEIITRGSAGHQYLKYVASDLVSHLSEYGYDGLVAEMRPGGPLEYAAVSPTQVKSIDNHGSWDPHNPNMLFQSAPQSGSGRYSQLLEKAHEVLKTSDGKLKVFYHGSYTAIRDFSKGELGFTTGADSAGQAFFFTEDEAIAGEYAIQATEAKPLRDRQRRLEHQKEMLERESDELLIRRNNDEITEEEYDDSQDALDHELDKLIEQLDHLEALVATGDYLYEMRGSSEPVVNKVIVSATKVLEVEGDISISETLEKAIADGYEAVYFKGITDSPSGEVSNNLAVFDASDIHSIPQSQQDLEMIPESSPWRLFQLANVESVVTVRDNAPKASRVYEVSMQPEEMHKLFGEDKPANLVLEEIDVARAMNANPARVADWQQIYARAMQSKGKDGKDLKFSNMRKVNKDGKLMDVPVIALSKGCQRAQVTVERVSNGVLPNETNVEACYGGTCWVNRQFNSKFGVFENMEVRDLLMPTPIDIDKWFKKSSIKEFLTTGPFIREGQMGCSSHAFPILEEYGVSLAETWLKNIRGLGIRQKTIFITAAYAPVTKESYERLLPYKDLFEIHVSISGWFHKNELMTRLAEFKTIRDVGLPVSFRIVTNKDNVANLAMPNQGWLDSQLSKLGIHQDEMLETPYHDDAIKKGQKRSEPTGDYKFICCETGKCATCGAKCMSKIIHQSSEMASYEQIDTYEKSPAVSTGLVPLDTSAIPQTQPSGTSNFTPEVAKNQLQIDRSNELSPDEPPTRLYQLSEKAKQQLLESRKREVMEAVRNFYWIPEQVIQEYAGEEWADTEIRFRKHLKDYPWILEEARKFSNTDEFLEHLQTNTEMGEYRWVLEDELWFKRVHAYSRIMSPKDKDSQFVRFHTGTDKALIELGRRLRGYEDVELKRNSNRRDYKGDHVVFRWGAFKGVSLLVKRLDANSSSEEIQQARKLVQDNPRPYRKAIQVIEQAQDRVLEMRGLMPNSEATRDAYYDTLGEEMSDALDEPLLLNQMTDREAAEYLRTSKDKRERYNAREKLATHDGVIAMEQQANAELKRLGAEKDQDIDKVKKSLSKAQSELKTVSDELRAEKKVLRSTQSALDKERARAWELVEKLDAKSRQASMVGQLERDLAGRRERVNELRRQLSIKNEQAKKLRNTVGTLEAKLKGKRLLEALEGMHKKILATVTFNPDSVDASFEEVFNAIHRLFEQDRRPGNWELIPEQMGQYIKDAPLHWIQQGRKINQWTLGELETLYEAARLMRMDAKVMLEQKKLHRMDRLQNIASQFYRQTYGELPEVGPNYGSLMNDIIDDLTQKRDTYDENIFNAIFNTVRSSIGKMQRISRMIDGNKEGVAYQLLVRDAYESMTEELRESYRRLQDADAKMKELKITSDYLAKEYFTYTTPSGQERILSKGEVIGLHVYSQNPMGAQKLIHNRGNNIPFDQLAKAIGSLSPQDKAWGDYMIDSLGGDEVWERMQKTYYEVYNRNLGRRKRYFTFVAEGKVDEGKTDLLVGPQGSKLRYVDKDFTKVVNPHAIYPLKLNVTHTFTSQVKKQEHFIQWADWTRDMNYLLAKGAVGRIIDMNHGPKFLNAVQEYVNDVGSPQSILDDIDRIGSKIISNAAVAALSLNFLTMLKQLPSFSSALRGDIGAIELANVAFRLTNPKTHGEAVKFIHEMSPYMLKRSISVEVEKYNASDFDSFVGRKIQAFNENIGMKGIQMMDQVAVNTLWLAAYDTYVRRNPNGLEEDALKKEAAFRATQLISETQPTSVVNDLSSLQRKKSPWVRAALLFSNQLFQYINMVWYDLPTSAKAYIATKNPNELRKIFGVVMNMAISGGLIMLVSGVAFRGDDDDEEYWDRIKREVLKMTASYTIPIVGNAVSQGVSGFYGGELVDLPSAFGRMMGTAVTDWEKMNSRIWDLLDGIGSIGGLPTAFINRAVKSLKGENPLELFGSAYGDLWEAR